MADRWPAANCKGKESGKQKILLLISGKRKCGKDYISQLIFERLGCELATILHISAPLKREFAEMRNLNYERLLDTSAYKETYRTEMVEWGEKMRRADPSYFCQKAVQSAKHSGKPVWIVADVRRKTDIEYFNRFHNLKLRLQTSIQVRSKRGWVFTNGIDDSETEVDLDDYDDWDFVIDNDGDNEAINRDINNVCKRLRKFVGVDAT